MNYKKIIWKKFQQAGVLDSQDSKVQEFVQFLRTSPAKCWEDVIPEFREKFYDCFDTVVPRLAEIDDPVIQLTLAKNVDKRRPKEKALLEKMAEDVDADRNPVLIKKIAGFKIAKVNTVLKSRFLPAELKKYIKD